MSSRGARGERGASVVIVYRRPLIGLQTGGWASDLTKNLSPRRQAAEVHFIDHDLVSWREEWSLNQAFTHRSFLNGAAALALLAAVSAQGVTTATLIGQITSQDGQALSGAQVVATNTATGVQRQTLTREDGRFLITGLRPGGPYTVTVQQIGYAEGRVEGLDLGLAPRRWRWARFGCRASEAV